MNASATPILTGTDAYRRIVHRTRGVSHGPVVRLVSPADLGSLIKPFVFLDLFDSKPPHRFAFGWHPHSGIATLTIVVEGRFRYEEAAGAEGVLQPGGIEWMRAAGGAWHTGSIIENSHVKGFQLWVALPPQFENGLPESQYLSAEDVPSDGPARILLGSYGKATSSISAPENINYLTVRLSDGENWTYTPPRGHTVAWIAVQRGQLLAPESVSGGELAVFAEAESAISFKARGETVFVLGSAVKHPHPLVLGSYSVHTNHAALAEGEAEIERIGGLLKAAGKLR